MTREFSMQSFVRQGSCEEVFNSDLKMTARLLRILRAVRVLRVVYVALSMIAVRRAPCAPWTLKGRNLQTGSRPANMAGLERTGRRKGANCVLLWKKREANDGSMSLALPRGPP
jgi:hypothetical protein